METLTYVIGSDKRELVSPSDDVTSNSITWSKATVHNWVEARQYEKELRSVIVYVKHDDGSAYDLTGFNYVFEGGTPDGIHRVYDAKHGIALDPKNGQFRFDFPEQAFATAGSYKQAFFRLMKDGLSVTTLEFDMTVLSDMVISGIMASDYISPFEDLYGQLETIVENADGDLTKFKTDWNTKLQAAFSQWTDDYATIENTAKNLKTQLAALEDQLQDDSYIVVGTATLADTDIFYPSIHAYTYTYGAGVPQVDVDIAGGTSVHDIDVRCERVTPTSVIVSVNAKTINEVMDDFAMKTIEVACNGSFAYLTSGIYSLAIEAKGSTVDSFVVDGNFAI